MQLYESIRLLSILLTHALVWLKSSTENSSTIPALQDCLKWFTVVSNLDWILVFIEKVRKIIRILNISQRNTVLAWCILQKKNPFSHKVLDFLLKCFLVLSYTGLMLMAYKRNWPIIWQFIVWSTQKKFYSVNLCSVKNILCWKQESTAMLAAVIWHSGDRVKC